MLSPTFLVSGPGDRPADPSWGIRQSFYTTGGLDAQGFAIEGDQFNGLKNYTAIFHGATG